MRVRPLIHIVPYYPPHLGGMEKCVEEIARIQAKSGRSVTVFTSSISVQQKKINSASSLLHIYYLQSIEFAHTPIIFSLFFRLLKIPQRSLMHLHISQALTPEIVCLVSMLRNIPYIAHIHLDVDSSGFFGFLLEPYKKIFLQYVLRHATKVICLTEEHRQAMIKKYTLIPQHTITIPNGVANIFFFNRSLQSKRVCTILFVGRLAKQKNIPTLLCALAQMKQNVHIDIVGDGEDAEALKMLSLNLGLRNVFFHGKKTRQELLFFYKNADIFVLPSGKEGMSLALLEAMAAGLPIVAFEVQGVKEILRQCALLVEIPDAQHLAKALDRIIKDGKLRKVLSQKAREKARKYTWEKTVAQIEEVYKEVEI